MSTLEAQYNAVIEAAVSPVKDHAGARHCRDAGRGAEAYAYPHQRGIAWGVNAAETGANLLRGIRRPDGTDEAVS